MKTLIKAALAATVATGLFASPALAANSATKAFTATAKIVKPLTLANTSLLDFGIITMKNSFAGGDVVISQAGVVTCLTDLTCTGTPKAGAFDATGVAFQPITITVPATASLKDVVSGKTLAFASDAPTSTQLDKDGAASFNIGGKITIPADAPDGTYGADINVTVAYQ